MHATREQIGPRSLPKNSGDPNMASSMILYLSEFCVVAMGNRAPESSLLWISVCFPFSIHVTFFHTLEEVRGGALSLYKLDEIFIFVFELLLLYLSLDFHLSGNDDGSIQMQATVNLYLCRVCDIRYVKPARIHLIAKEI